MGHNITLSSVNKSSLAVNYGHNITLSSVNRSQGGCQLMDVNQTLNSRPVARNWQLRA